MLYTILRDTSVSGLINAVSRYINDGWVPCGGMAIEISEYCNWYCQAMTKR